MLLKELLFVPGLAMNSIGIHKVGSLLALQSNIFMTVRNSNRTDTFGTLQVPVDLLEAKPFFDRILIQSKNLFIPLLKV